VEFWETPAPVLVMPYCSFGNLEDLSEVGRIAREEAKDIVSQTLTALAFLHPRGVAHRDFKPENVLVESRSLLSIKLADFGLANDKPDLDTFCGTYR
jgi:serine/threonine protein kinase